MKISARLIAASKKAACIALTAVFCGCSATGLTSFGVEELLRAPQPSPEQNAIQKALNAHFGETLQLKYPRSGNEMTPFIMRDFDGDGQLEAAVLYTSAAKGQNVHLAVLEHMDGAWAVVQEIEGLSSEVLLVDSAAFYPDMPESLVIGYTAQSLNDKFLAVYTYEDETISPVFTQAYTNYAICDIDGDELDEIIYTQAAKLSLYVVETIDGERKMSANLPLDERFGSCVGLAAGENGTVAVDGALQGTGIATALFQVQDGRLAPVAKEGIDIFSLSKRYVPSLLSVDIDMNTGVDIPCVLQSIDTFNTTRRFYYIVWNDFTAKKTEKRYGVYDAKYNYFVRLPSEWRNEYNLTDDGSDDGGWHLREKNGFKTVLSFKIVPRSYENTVFTEAAMLGEKRLLLSFGDSVSSSHKNIITSGVSVF